MTASDLWIPLDTNLPETSILCLANSSCTHWITSQIVLQPAFSDSTLCSSHTHCLQQTSWYSASEMLSRVWIVFWWKKTILKLCRISPCRKKSSWKAWSCSAFLKMPILSWAPLFAPGYVLKKCMWGTPQEEVTNDKKPLWGQRMMHKPEQFMTCIFMHAKQPITYIHAHFIVLKPGAIFYSNPWTALCTHPQGPCYSCKRVKALKNHFIFQSVLCNCSKRDTQTDKQSKSTKQLCNILPKTL